MLKKYLCGKFVVRVWCGGASSAQKWSEVERVERLLVGHVVEDVEEVPARERGFRVQGSEFRVQGWQLVVRVWRCVVSPKVECGGAKSECGVAIRGPHRAPGERAGTD